MTKNNINDNTSALYRRRKFSLVFTFLCCSLVFLLSLFASDKIAHSVKSALSLCANVIIPSVFPFIVISDFLYAYMSFSSANIIGDAFEKIFKINRVGIYPFVLGILCGFPLGVKCTSELYRDGKITRDEAERLIGFCNNTGPAFLVSGIGLGLRKNASDGLILYFVMVVSAVITGAVFSGKKNAHTENRSHFIGSAFSFTSSIKNAGVNTLHICSYLTFFACIVGMLRNTIGENYIYLSLIPFLEVGSATSILSKTRLLSPSFSLALSSFAVGFSGLSVHLQALSFIADTDIRTRKYFLMKLFEGVISFTITLILCALLL